MRPKNIRVKAKPQPQAPTYTRNNVVVRSIDRSPKDVATLRKGQKAAESVHAPNRCRLYDLYDDILMDAHLTGITEKRTDSILNKTLSFRIGEKKVDALDDLIASLKFRDVMKLIHHSKYWGISGIEFIPGADFDFVAMERKHIKPHIGIYAYEQNGTEGVDYTNAWNMWVVGDAKDLGLLLKCAVPALYKRGDLADWAQFVEIFGMPVRVIKYDAHDTQTKLELDKALKESGSALEIRIPNQANFEMLDGKASNGDGQLQERLMKAMNSEMSVAILGNTETTTSSRSSGYAQSETHSNQQDLITLSDMIYVAGMLNSAEFLAILKSYGYPVDGGKFVFAEDVNPKAVLTKIGIFKGVQALGLPIDADEVYKTAGISKPSDFEAQMKKREAETRQRSEQPPAPSPSKRKKPADPEASWYEEPSTWQKFCETVANFFAPPRS